MLDCLPFSEIGKLLKFLQISYEYLNILIDSVPKKYFKLIWQIFKFLCKYEPAIVRLPQSVCKCQFQIPKGGKS